MANQCLEETITLKERGDRYTYSLSNNISDIQAAIYTKTGHNVSLTEVVPKLNPQLSVSVREMMNKHNVEFSMTTFMSNGYEIVVINRFANGQWFSVFLSEVDGVLCIVR